MFVWGGMSASAFNDLWSFNFGTVICGLVLACLLTNSPCAETRTWKKWELRGTAPQGSVFSAGAWADSTTWITFGGRDGNSLFHDDSKYCTAFGPPRSFA